VLQQLRDELRLTVLIVEHDMALVMGTATASPSSTTEGHRSAAPTWCATTRRGRAYLGTTQESNGPMMLSVEGITAGYGRSSSYGTSRSTSPRDRSPPARAERRRKTTLLRVIAARQGPVGQVKFETR